MLKLPVIDKFPNGDAGAPGNVTGLKGKTENGGVDPVAEKGAGVGNVGGGGGTPHPTEVKPLPLTVDVYDMGPPLPAHLNRASSLPPPAHLNRASSLPTLGPPGMALVGRSGSAWPIACDELSMATGS